MFKKIKPWVLMIVLIVLLVAYFLVKHFSSNDRTFRDKVLDFDPAAVTEVLITVPGQPEKTHLKLEGQEWKVIIQDQAYRADTNNIKSMLMEPGFVVLPDTLTGIAVNYFLRNWEEATRFLASGDLPIDNSADERIIRPFAIGRNNWMQAGSENGARWMAILYSIITTCKLNDIDPEAYLEDVLMRLAIRPENADISDLLPMAWFKNKNGGITPAHTPLYPSNH